MGDLQAYIHLDKSSKKYSDLDNKITGMVKLQYTARKNFFGRKNARDVTHLSVPAMTIGLTLRGDARVSHCCSGERTPTERGHNFLTSARTIYRGSYEATAETKCEYPFEIEIPVAKANGEAYPPTFKTKYRGKLVAAENEVIYTLHLDVDTANVHIKADVCSPLALHYDIVQRPMVLLSCQNHPQTLRQDLQMWNIDAWTLEQRVAYSFTVTCRTPGPYVHRGQPLPFRVAVQRQHEAGAPTPPTPKIHLLAFRANLCATDRFERSNLLRDGISVRVAKTRTVQKLYGARNLGTFTGGGDDWKIFPMPALDDHPDTFTIGDVDAEGQLSRRYTFYISMTVEVEHKKEVVEFKWPVIMGRSGLDMSPRPAEPPGYEDGEAESADDLPSYQQIGDDPPPYQEPLDRRLHLSATGSTDTLRSLPLSTLTSGFHTPEGPGVDAGSLLSFLQNW